MSTKRDAAEVRALQALGWLAEVDLLDPFMAATGADRDQIASAAETPEFLGAVLDFVLTEDRWVTDCAAAQGLSPDDLLAARAALPGGDLPHWT